MRYLVPHRAALVVACSVLGACGGFTTPTPGTEVAVSLRESLPLTMAGTAHTSRLDEGAMVFQPLQARVASGSFVTVTQGPLILAGPSLTPTLTLVDPATLPRGDYTELKVRLVLLDPGTAGDVALAKQAGFPLQVSSACELKGEFDGKPYRVLCTEPKEVVVKLKTPWLVRAGSTAQLKLTVDPKPWLVDDGEPVDPFGPAASHEIAEHLARGLAGESIDDP
ncbi:MAG: hypothetical protein K1X89_22370 [Myxococcaceae bacterium]|nr:hypothetical protein [Myxococcaceae bacterium]